MQRSFSIAICAAIAVLIWASGGLQDANAQGTRPVAATLGPYVVSGFRSAKFGMSESEVRAAITRDFGLPDRNIRRAENGVDGTAALLARVEKLDPAPGPAAISYVFGATSKRLMHVNIVWAASAAEAAGQRSKFVAAGQRLSRHFMQYRWRNNVVITGTKVGPSSLVTFLGKDSKGGAAEVRLDGVLLIDNATAKPLNPGIELGPVRLRVSYAENPNKPDIKRVEKGTF